MSKAAGTHGCTVQKPIRACNIWRVPNSWDCPMAGLSGGCRAVSHACGSPGTWNNVPGVCNTVLRIFLLKAVSTGKRLGHSRRKGAGEHTRFSVQRAGEAAGGAEDPCFGHAGWEAEADAGSRGERTAAAGRDPAAGGRWAFQTGKRGRLLGLQAVCRSCLLVGRSRGMGAASALTLVMASFKIQGESLVKRGWFLPERVVPIELRMIWISLQTVLLGLSWIDVGF